ncbi:MAG: PEP-CTERM sorting domain-containing protein [Planctomycetaceae bacterium]
MKLAALRVHSVCVVIALFTLVNADDAIAATIHYVNPTPPPVSQAFAAVDVTASGVVTAPSPTVTSSAFGGSLSHTRLGPSPPFTAMATGQAEIFTNLNSVAPTTSRTISIPGFGRFYAEGTGTAASDSYSADSRVYSGDNSSLVPSLWTIFVNATGLEVPGTPTLVTIDASIVGEVAASGGGNASANWLLSSSYGSIMNGSAGQFTPGLTPFSDSGSLSFIIPLNSSFQLTLLYELNATGSGVSDSRAEVFASTGSSLMFAKEFGPMGFLSDPTVTALTITAEVGALATPEPSSILLSVLGAVGMWSGYSRRRRKE